MPVISCINCQNEYPSSGVPFLCPECGGVFDFTAPPAFLASEIDDSKPGIWRYHTSFGLGNGSPVVTLGEGKTPLVLQEYHGKQIGFKLEYLNPTGSHKDRATAPLVSKLTSQKIKMAVEDSSGNAGASFAAYAANQGIKTKIFMPQTASGPKKKQIESYGAEIVGVIGPRSSSTEAAVKHAKEGYCYASHAYLPFGINGLATISYEIWEDLGKSPGTVIIPAGHGSLALGIVRGFLSLSLNKLIEQVPFFVIVQPEACAPICSVASGKSFDNSSLKRTVAEGTCVVQPVRGKALLEEIQPDHAMFIRVKEDDINICYHELAKCGFYVEPTSALVWSALKNHIHHLPEPIILILTGSGLKT